MLDDVVAAKAAIVERCVARVRAEYAATTEFRTDLTHQDAALLNLQRACEATIDLAQRVVRLRSLGLAQTSRENFALLADAKLIDASMADRLSRMTGFRNIAIHDYRSLDLNLVEDVIRNKLGDLLEFSKIMVKLG